MALDLGIAKPLVDPAVLLPRAAQLVLEERPCVFYQPDLPAHPRAGQVELVGELLERDPAGLALQRQHGGVIGRIAASTGARPPYPHHAAVDREPPSEHLPQAIQQIVAGDQIDANAGPDHRADVAVRKHGFTPVRAQREPDHRPLATAEDVGAQTPQVRHRLNDDAIRIGGVESVEEKLVVDREAHPLIPIVEVPHTSLYRRVEGSRSSSPTATSVDT